MKKLLCILLSVLLLPLSAFAYSGPSTNETEVRNVNPLLSAFYNNSLYCQSTTYFTSKVEGYFCANTSERLLGKTLSVDEEEKNGVEDTPGTLHMKSETVMQEGTHRLRMDSPVFSEASFLNYYGGACIELSARFADLVEIEDGLFEGVTSPVWQAAFHPDLSYTKETSYLSENVGRVGYTLEVSLPLYYGAGYSYYNQCSSLVLSFARYDNPNGGGEGVATNAVITLAAGDRHELDRDAANIQFIFANLDFENYHRYTLNYYHNYSTSGAPYGEVELYVDGVYTASFSDVLNYNVSSDSQTANDGGYVNHAISFSAASCKSDSEHYNDVYIDSVLVYDQTMSPMGITPGDFAWNWSDRNAWQNYYDRAVALNPAHYTKDSMTRIETALQEKTRTPASTMTKNELWAWIDELKTALNSLVEDTGTTSAECEAKYQEAIALDLSGYSDFSAGILQAVLNKITYPFPESTDNATFIQWTEDLTVAIQSLKAARTDHVGITQTARKGEEGAADATVRELKENENDYYGISLYECVNYTDTLVYAFPETELSAISIAWYQGDLSSPSDSPQRRYAYEIQISNDGGRTWITLCASHAAGGVSEEYYSVSGRANLMRIIGRSSYTSLFGLRDVAVYGTPTGGAAGDAVNASDIIKIACVGDSITWGSGSGDDPSNPGYRIEYYNYPSQFSRLLGAQYEVTEYGIPGVAVMKNGSMDDGSGGYQYSEACNAAIAYKPDVIIVELGTNDSKDTVWSQLNDGAEDFRAALTKLVERFRYLLDDPRIYFMIPPYVMDHGTNGSNYSISEERLQSEIIPILTDVANSMSCGIIDPRKVLPDPEKNQKALCDLYVDCVHPNSAGYTLIAEQCARVIQENSTDGYSFGDVTMDAKVDLADLTHMVKKYNGWKGVTCPFFQSDVNWDGKFTLLDLNLLAKYVSGWEVKIGWEEL